MLLYTALVSLDGYIEDPTGSFDWAMPDAAVHRLANDLSQSVGTELYGRRMYETMAVWQRVEAGPGVEAEEVAFAEGWRGHDKVVFSRTLDAVSTPRTRLEREFDPGAVRALIDGAGHDVGISGPGLAQHAFAAGLVDDLHLFVIPVIVGGGKPGLPRDVRLDLELVDERRFANGTVYLHHRVR